MFMGAMWRNWKTPEAGTRTNFIGYWDSCVFLVYYICTCIYLATCPDLKNVEFFGAGWLWSFLARVV